MEWNIENIVRITIKHLETNQTLVLKNPLGIDVPLNKLN